MRRNRSEADGCGDAGKGAGWVGGRRLRADRGQRVGLITHELEQQVLGLRPPQAGRQLQRARQQPRLLGAAPRLWPFSGCRHNRSRAARAAATAGGGRRLSGSAESVVLHHHLSGGEQHACHMRTQLSRLCSLLLRRPCGRLCHLPPLALGDQAVEQFRVDGKDLGEQLAALGAVNGHLPRRLPERHRVDGTGCLELVRLAHAALVGTQLIELAHHPVPDFRRIRPLHG